MSGVIDRLVRGLLMLLGVMLLGMVVLSVWNVASRYIFSASLLWADEIAVFGMIVLGWLGAIVVAWRKMEIRMGIVSDALPLRLQTWLTGIQYLTAAILCGWVAWLSWGYVAKLLKFGMTSDGARIPLWTIHISITISLAFLCLISIYRLFCLVLAPRSRAASKQEVLAK